MAISKRLRYLIFRRDYFSCVYCGRRPPSVTLEVDHRIPRVMGGSDDPNNLVAACWDCNRGKGPLDAGGEPPDDDQYYDEILGREFCSDEREWPDELPPWMLPRSRGEIVLDFDVYAAADELPEADFITTMRPEAVYRIAGAFTEAG